MFSPAVAAAESKRGSDALVPTVMAQGWERLPAVSPALARAVLPLLDDPTPLVQALGRVPHTLVHGDWKAANLGSHPDGRTVLLDFGEAPGEASPLADLSWYLALNAALLPEPKHAVLQRYRTALEGHGVETEAWWDEAVALEMLGCMLQFGWEKALGGAGDELSWWEHWSLLGAASLGTG
jgi:Ser/Thr protein kinase RdoA (MazF antagonist)